MNLPWGFVLFALAFFLFMAAANFVQAHRKKEKFYYFAGMVSSLVVVVVILLVLGQYILASILFAILAVIGVVTFPKTLKFYGRNLKFRERELAKQLQKVDLSSPLRVKDFFTSQGWLKLASKWGLRKTMCLSCLLFAVTIGGVLYTLSIFYGFPSIPFVVVHTTISPILWTFLFYRIFYLPFQEIFEEKRRTIQRIER